MCELYLLFIKIRPTTTTAFNSELIAILLTVFLTTRLFIDNNHVIQVVRRIIAPLGRRIDESVPLVDAPQSAG